VAAFLKDCEYLRPPSDNEAATMAARYLAPPATDGVKLPQRVIALDGSYYEASIDERLPSTKIGYVKVGAILIQLADFQALREGAFVDPFKVARLKENNDALTFSLPSANIRSSGRATVVEAFRAVIDERLGSDRTRFVPTDSATSLKATLFELASHRKHGTNDSTKLVLHRCPGTSCSAENLIVYDQNAAQKCSSCGGELFAADCLRLYEEVSEFQSNQVPMSRFMMLLEHMLPVHYCRYLLKVAPQLLSETAFFIDGPLALFGTAAWLHASVLSYLAYVNKRLVEMGLKPTLVIGLQKTGQAVDHAMMISKFVPNDRLLAIDDDYRYQYILAGREASANGFGGETYYGQDFIYRTPTGRTFVFGLPYPFATKAEVKNFTDEKVKFAHYTELSRALALIKHFETDLYQNAVIPIALAHRYTAISLMPGGRVLDVMTKAALDAKAPAP
jgi:NurA domain